MKKIGIITIHNSPNYGACLQSFALYEYIRQKGYDVYVIDLHRPCNIDYIESSKYKPNRYRFETLNQKCKRLIKKMLPVLKRGRKDRLNENPSFQCFTDNFASFNNQIKLTCPFRCIDELYSNPPKFDTYITGSDQVWNPTQEYCIEPYFLSFVKSGRKISYASSIGIEELTELEKRQFKQWLSSYDAISVREETAQKTLSEITGSQIERVSDPTFLLDSSFWHNLAVKPEKQDYILLFTLSYNIELTEYALKIAKESNKELICLNKQPKDSRLIQIVDVSPEEWLGYIENAHLVITDSFHCTLFSILLECKNFYTYIAPWNDRGSRIKDLLKLLLLSDHLLSIERDRSYDCLVNKKIDYSVVNAIIEQERNKSREFLLKSI